MCKRGGVGLSFLGKILFGTISFFYLVGGIVLISTTPLYLIYGYGIYETRYKMAQEECPKESVKNQCEMGLGVTLVAATLGLTLGILLFISGFALIIYCCVLRRHLWSLVIVPASFFVFLSCLILILFFVASFSKELADHCEWKVKHLPVEDDKTGEINSCQSARSDFDSAPSQRIQIPQIPQIPSIPKPPATPDNVTVEFNCSMGPIFATYRTLQTRSLGHDTCLKNWITFHVITTLVYKIYIGLISGTLVLTCAALFLLLLTYCCGQVIKGQVSVLNIPPNVDNSQVQKKFKTAQKTEIDRKTETAQVEFENRKESDHAFENSDLIKIGHLKLKWTRSDEIYILNVLPFVTEKTIQDEFPTAKKITFETTEFESKERIATLLFGDEDEADKEHEKSLRRKLGYHQLDGNTVFICLNKDPCDPEQNSSDSVQSTTSLELPTHSFIRFSLGSKKSAETPNTNTNVPPSPLVKKISDPHHQQPQKQQQQQQQQPQHHQENQPQPKIYPQQKPPEKPKQDLLPKKDLADEGNEHLEDEVLANKMWGETTTKFSNISHLFKTDIYVTNLPDGVSKTELTNVFKGAKRAYINHNLAMVGFDTRKEAAHGYKAAAPKLVRGKKLHITIYRPEHLLRRESRIRHIESKISIHGNSKSMTSIHTLQGQETKQPQDGGLNSKQPQQQQQQPPKQQQQKQPQQQQQKKQSVKSNQVKSNQVKPQ